MKNYRIKRVDDGYSVRFYPQVKFLGFIWVNMLDWSNYYDGFSTYDKAKEELCNAIRKPRVDYYDVDCDES